MLFSQNLPPIFIPLAFPWFYNSLAYPSAYGVCVYVCICVCSCFCLCVHTHAYIRACGGQKSMLDVFPNQLLSYFLRQAFSLSSVTELDWLEPSKPQRLSCLHHTFLLGLQAYTATPGYSHTWSHLAFYLGSGEPNSGSLACVVNTWPPQDG